MHDTANQRTGQESQLIYLHPAQALPWALGTLVDLPQPTRETLLRMHPMLAVPHPQHSHAAHTVGRLATCPYFGPGHEQETPEGQEE